MKTAESLLASATARLKQAKNHAECVAHLSANIAEYGITAREVKVMRSEAEKMLQCVHEFSAYWNAYATK